MYCYPILILELYIKNMIFFFTNFIFIYYLVCMYYIEIYIFVSNVIQLMKYFLYVSFATVLSPV